jgi:transposase
MARKPDIPDKLACCAREKAKTADNAHELRKAQSILLPALFSLDLVATGTVLGRSKASVCRLQAEFKADCTGNQSGPKKRGGRQRQNMSADQEAQFLAPFFQKAGEGVPIVVAEIRQAYETAIGKKVPASTIYRLLARHGWSPPPTSRATRNRKQMP